MSSNVDHGLWAVPDAERWRSADFWKGTLTPLTEATGLDPVAYTDPSFFADEQHLVFERSWVCIGLAGDAQPGKVLVRSVGTRSVLITCDDAGVVHGHINSCRHRGTELYECDSEIRDTLRCPYHRWGYGSTAG